MSSKTSSKATSKLVPGDIVLSHGMRLLIETVPSGNGHHPQGAISTDARLLNVEEVLAHGFIPRSFIARADGIYRWMIQGNDLALWAVETTNEEAGL